MNRRKKILSAMPDPQPHRNKPRKRKGTGRRWKVYNKATGYSTYENIR